MKRFFVILKDLYFLFFKSRYTTLQKIRVFLTYTKLVIKRFFHGRISVFFSYKSHNFLGFKIKLENFSDFYWVFRDVFIYEEYFFSSNDRKPTIVDCGGNIGITVLYFKYIYPESKIVSFEPETINFNLLKNNIETNSLKEVKVVQCALSDQEGSLRLYGNRILATIHTELIEEQKKLSAEDREYKTEVKIEKLSKYLNDYEKINYLKLDIEGAEANVLRDIVKEGFIDRVESCGMEFHYFDESKNSLAEIIKYFENHDFNLGFKMNTANVSHVPKKQYFNFMLYAAKKH